VLERLVVAGSADPSAIAAEFPSIAVSSGVADARAVSVDAVAWDDPSFDFAALDAQIAHAAERGPLTVRLTNARDARVAVELCTRYQRFVDRRNEASRAPLWDRIREAHRALHRLELPLVRADYDHALDTWQWLLRLRPDAGLAVQAAALFHDVERLESEATVRVEHRAPSYELWKDAHARRGAEMTRATLLAAGASAAVGDRAASLVAGHERPSADADGASVNEADALSFFSHNAAGYLDYFGPAQTAKKIAYTLARLRPSTLQRLGSIRHRADVRALILAALDRSPEAGACGS
jgi:hypothetical protein